MVSKYDVFYTIATKGELRTVDIINFLQKSKNEYKNIYNNIKLLEAQGYITAVKNIKIIQNSKSRKLFDLISFCAHNNMNYNLIFKSTMIYFLQKAAVKEYFTITDIKIHNQTFNFYTNLLSKYGLLLIVSRKPLRCKLLRHHFLIKLLNFFNKKTKFYRPTQHTFTAQINKEFKKYQQNIKIYYNIIQNLKRKESIEFIHSSLHLEGNPITLPDTQKIIIEEIIPKNYKLTSVQEITNYKKAVDEMIENAEKKVKLSSDLILNYHKTAMNHIKESGILRKQNVIIKLNPNFKTSDWQSISLKINNLIQKYNEFEKRKKNIDEIISFAAFFHNEFQRIHPFIDGNSRISRLLMLHILRSYQLPVLDFPIGYFDVYLDLTKRSTKRDDESFKHFIEELVFFNLKKANKLIN